MHINSEPLGGSIIGGSPGADWSVSISEEILLPHLQPSHSRLCHNGRSTKSHDNRSDPGLFLDDIWSLEML